MITKPKTKATLVCVVAAVLACAGCLPPEHLPHESPVWHMSTAIYGKGPMGGAEVCGDQGWREADQLG